MARASARGATFEAPPNIALIKYWGVRDVERALPYNTSVSVTLDRFRSRTSVRFDPVLAEDSFVLNGLPATGGPREAVVRFLDRVRERAGLEDRAHVVSSNNFPTASGLASSASGFAALAGAASRAAGLRLTPAQLSQLARFGSGSASRSLFGGFVEWRAGTRPDGRDCYARALHPPGHWRALVDLVAIVERAPVKSVRSADAMQRSVDTSPRFAARQEELPARIRGLERALRSRDGPETFRLIMEECDSFRWVCESTRPALDYLTGASRSVLEAVRERNREAGEPVAGYTHDAGAHVHVFTLAKEATRLRGRLARVPGVQRVLLLRPGPGARPVGAASAAST